MFLIGCQGRFDSSNDLTLINMQLFDTFLVLIGWLVIQMALHDDKNASVNGHIITQTADKL